MEEKMVNNKKKNYPQSNNQKPSHRDLNRVSGLLSAIQGLVGLSRKLKKK